MPLQQNVKMFHHKEILSRHQPLKILQVRSKAVRSGLEFAIWSAPAKLEKIDLVCGRVNRLFGKNRLFTDNIIGSSLLAMSCREFKF